MINFLIIALPRSGTAWIANLFTAGRVLCHHDPVCEVGMDGLAALGRPGLTVGIADTSLALMPSIVERLHCPVIKIVRPVEDINESLARCGITHRFTDADESLFLRIPGWNLPFEALHDYAIINEAFRYATGNELDRSRFELLCKLNIQRHPASIAPDYSIINAAIGAAKGG